MAYLANLRSLGLVFTRANLSGRLVRMFSSELTPENQEKDIVTHTGQPSPVDIASEYIGCLFGGKKGNERKAANKSYSADVKKKFKVFQPDDYRRSRYLDCDKYVNPRFAIDLVKEQPVVICTERVVVSDGGGPLGHPRIYINLDQPGYHICGYSGRRFVLKKHYDEKSMGPGITYDKYCEEIGKLDD